MVVVFLILVSTALSPAAAHIHSHKVSVGGTQVSLEVWGLALASSVLVAAAGVFPLLLNRCLQLDRAQGGLAMRALLNFAVGGLLGDVFLHLLPEAWGPASGSAGDWRIGGWVLLGFTSFLFVEKLAGSTESAEPAGERSHSSLGPSNGHIRKTGSQESPANQREREGGGSGGGGREVRGYLNLVANCTDNFTHGLAIAASYVASPTVGVLTTAAILCHEIPHEVGDFAILLNSGFDIWSAARAQALTATGGVVGVIAGLTAEQLSSTSSWLLPFTAGGFLYIALVSIIPQLLREEEEAGPSSWGSLLELLVLVVGIVCMALVSMVERESCRHMPPLNT